MIALDFFYSPDKMRDFFRGPEWVRTEQLDRIMAQAELWRIG